MKLFSKTYCYHYKISLHKPDSTIHFDGTITTDKRITYTSYLRVRADLEEKYKVGDLVNHIMLIESLTLL